MSTATKTTSLLLTSGLQGEINAAIAGKAVEFSKVLIGDANGQIPVMDENITELVNYKADGAILGHVKDPNVSTQRKVIIKIPPNENYNAIEILLYAKYGNVEFPHTYITLASPFPVRTFENGLSQLTINSLIRVSQNTDFAIHVVSDLTQVTHGELRSFNIPVPLETTTKLDVENDILYLFKQALEVDLPNVSNGTFRYMLAPDVDPEITRCVFNAPSVKDPTNGPQMKVNDESADKCVVDVKRQVFRALIIDGVWNL